MTSQKELFVASEGDAWFRRNQAALQARDWSIDPLCKKIAILSDGSSSRILEIGCGDGSRLEYLGRNFGHEVSGVEPSSDAVQTAARRGVNALLATADRLPFADSSFDIVIFGFCLYLCDDEDLFRIAAEADRVLVDPGWLLILDFDAPAPHYRPYHHVPGIRSRKMAYRKMFLWHPAYTVGSYDKFKHGNEQWTDDPEEWVSLACLRKRRPK